MNIYDSARLFQNRVYLLLLITIYRANLLRNCRDSTLDFREIYLPINKSASPVTSPDTECDPWRKHTKLIDRRDIGAV